MLLKEDHGLEVRKQKSNPLTSSPNLKSKIFFQITYGNDKMSLVFLGGMKMCSLSVISHDLSHMIQSFFFCRRRLSQLTFVTRIHL